MEWTSSFHFSSSPPEINIGSCLQWSYKSVEDRNSRVCRDCSGCCWSLLVCLQLWMFVCTWPTAHNSYTSPWFSYHPAMPSAAHSRELPSSNIVFAVGGAQHNIIPWYYIALVGYGWIKPLFNRRHHSLCLPKYICTYVHKCMYYVGMLAF